MNEVLVLPFDPRRRHSGWMSCDLCHQCPVAPDGTVRIGYSIVLLDTITCYTCERALWNEAWPRQYGGWLARVATRDLPQFSPGQRAYAYLPDRQA